MGNFLSSKPFLVHILVAVMTVAVVVCNARLGLGMDQDQVHATIALGIALIIGKSVHDGANILGDAHVESAEKIGDAHIIASHIAAGNVDPDGNPKEPQP